MRNGERASASTIVEGIVLHGDPKNSVRTARGVVEFDGRGAFSPLVASRGVERHGGK
jgi:hypothetical protein